MYSDHKILTEKSGKLIKKIDVGENQKLNNN